jgi:hypothetical protein
MLRAIVEANGDLAVRLAQLGVAADYNPDLDIFMLTIGPPAEALTESIDNSIGVRVDPRTLKLVGLEILNLHGSMRNAAVACIVALVATILSPQAVPRPEGVVIDLHERLAGGIRELLPAA